MNYQAKTQELSALRLDMYEAAGAVCLTNDAQAKALWAVADAVGVAIDALQRAESLEPKAPEFVGNPWDMLA